MNVEMLVFEDAIVEDALLFAVLDAIVKRGINSFPDLQNVFQNQNVQVSVIIKLVCATQIKVRHP